MNDLMNLPSLILERLEENELILVRGGEDPDDKAQVSVEESIILQGGVAN